MPLERKPLAAKLSTTATTTEVVVVGADAASSPTASSSAVAAGSPLRTPVKQQVQPRLQLFPIAPSPSASPRFLPTDSPVPASLPDGTRLSLRLQYVFECERLSQNVNRSLALLLPKLPTDAHVLVEKAEWGEQQREQQSPSASSRRRGAAADENGGNNNNTEQQWRKFYPHVDGEAIAGLNSSLFSSSSPASPASASSSVRSKAQTNNYNNLDASVVAASTTSNNNSSPIRATSLFGDESPITRTTTTTRDENEGDPDLMITEIDCSRNVLGERGLLPLIPILKRILPNLKRLLLERCGLTDVSLGPLLTQVVADPACRLDLLDLRGNPISQEGGKTLYRFVTSNNNNSKNITKILVAGCEMINAGLVKLIENPDTAKTAVRATLRVSGPEAQERLAQLELAMLQRDVAEEEQDCRDAIEQEEQEAREPMKLVLHEETAVATQKREEKAAFDAKVWIEEQRKEIQVRQAQAAVKKAEEESNCVVQ